MGRPLWEEILKIAVIQKMNNVLGWIKYGIQIYILVKWQKLFSIQEWTDNLILIVFIYDQGKPQITLPEFC